MTEDLSAQCDHSAVCPTCGQKGDLREAFVDLSTDRGVIPGILCDGCGTAYQTVWARGGGRLVVTKDERDAVLGAWMEAAVPKLRKAIERAVRSRDVDGIRRAAYALGVNIKRPRTIV